VFALRTWDNTVMEGYEDMCVFVCERKRNGRLGICDRAADGEDADSTEHIWGKQTKRSSVQIQAGDKTG